MLEQLTKEQHDAVYSGFMAFLYIFLSNYTGERRDRPAKDEDDPMFWEPAAYPKTGALFRDLVDRYCP